MDVVEDGVLDIEEDFECEVKFTGVPSLVLMLN